MSRGRENIAVVATVSVVCVASWIADAWTKVWALDHSKAEILTLVPGLIHVLVPPLRNYSAGSLVPGMGMGAMSGFAEHGTIVIPILLSIAAFVWMIRVQRSAVPLTMMEQIGFGMLLGGTFSNLYDRLVRHCVIDFMHLSICDFWLWNVADVTIALGLFLVGLDALRLHRLLRVKPREMPQVSAQG